MGRRWIRRAMYVPLKPLSVLVSDRSMDGQEGCTALRLAAQYGRALTAELLLKHGAQVDLPDKVRLNAL